MSKKLEEKQRRRQIEEERESARRRAARKRNFLTWGVVVVVAALVVTLIALEKKKDAGPVGVDPAVASCTEIQNPDLMPTANHVDDGTTVQYSTNPPTSGDHWLDPAPAGFNPPSALGDPPNERLVHNMEHGQIIFWYRPDASAVIDDLQAYFDNTNAGIALLGQPYEGVPASYNFTMTAWGHSQSCKEVSQDVIDAFREEFQGKTTEAPNIGIPTFSASE
jgi:hypothetical protein